MATIINTLEVVQAASTTDTARNGAPTSASPPRAVCAGT
jgi:hypothetical protein